MGKPDIMSKLDITVEDITKALQDQNVISPGGKFGAEPHPHGTEFTYGVVLQDRLIQESQFAEIIIKSKEDGSKVLLGDIAEIKLGTENYNSVSRMNSKPAATIAIFRHPVPMPLKWLIRSRRLQLNCHRDFLMILNMIYPLIQLLLLQRV